MKSQSKYARILNAASELAREEGLPALTRDRVAERADVAPSLMYHYFDGMDGLKDTVMAMAIDMQDVELVSRGLAIQYRAAMKAPPELRRKAVRRLTAEIMGEQG